VTRAVAVALLALAGACAGTAAERRAAKDAVITIACDVGEAEVWVNDRYLRRCQDLRGGMALSAGTHRIEVRHDAYHTHYVELTVLERERRQLDVRLAERLP
jgi:hypothetical protein